jgi:hypothetical protein
MRGINNIGWSEEEGPEGWFNNWLTKDWRVLNWFMNLASMVSNLCWTWVSNCARWELVEPISDVLGLIDGSLQVLVVSGGHLERGSVGKEKWVGGTTKKGLISDRYHDDQGEKGNIME